MSATVMASCLAAFAASALMGGHASVFLPAGAALLGGLAMTLFAARALSAILRQPANTLLAIGQLEGDAAADLRSPARLEAELQRLDRLAVHAVQEKHNLADELQRVRDVAQAETRARADFLGGISHELRTPLNAITGYAMLLFEDVTEKGDPAMAGDLDRILVSSRRLLWLINDILDLSRLEAGALAVQRDAIDVPALMAAVAADAGPRIAQTAIASNVVLLSDGSKLRRALTCLLNAVICDRSTGLTLAATQPAPSDGLVRFTISGKDLDLSFLAEADMATASGMPATAAGLAANIVHRIMALLGGNIETSDDGVRQTAQLVLPLDDKRPGVQEGATATDAVALKRGRDPSGPRVILVIDDDTPTVDIMRRWLNHQGYRVISAGNGRDGLAKARREQPDFIILDIFMPGASGYEVLAELRADPDLQSIPVIIASSGDNRRLGLEAGAAEVLVKPVSRDWLFSILKVLEERISGDVLVIDDEADAREIVRRFGRMAGVNVRLASSAQEGLRAAREMRPSVIVLDLCMPDMDGFAMIEALAGDDALRKVPVMVLSQLDISPAQYAQLSQAGHVFQSKWNASPVQIVENIKIMAAR
jgi:CheY-like chemotaxis protein